MGVVQVMVVVVMVGALGLATAHGDTNPVCASVKNKVLGGGHNL
jgi:hypothetical protein